MTLVEIAALVFGTGAGGGVLVHSIAYAARHVPVSLADAKLKRAEAEALEKKSKVIEAETVRDWREDTGRVIGYQRKDIEHERGEATKAKKAELDCKDALAKLDAECRARDAANTMRIVAQEEVMRAQRHETKNVRAALQLLLDSNDVTRSIPPEAVAAAKVALEHDAAKTAKIEVKP